MPAVLRSGIAPNRLDTAPEKAPERPCTVIPGRRDHSTGPDRVRPARGDVCRDSCTVPISRPCTTTHGSVRAGSSPCRRGGSRFRARPIGGRLVNAPRRATGWSWGATPAPRPGPRSAGRRGGGPSLAGSRRGSTGRRVRSARRWRLSSRPTGTVGDDDDRPAGRGGVPIARDVAAGARGRRRRRPDRRLGGWLASVVEARPGSSALDAKPNPNAGAAAPGRGHPGARQRGHPGARGSSPVRAAI